LARTSDNLVGGFCAAVRHLLAEHQAQEVKTIGEALLTAATRSACDVVEGVECCFCLLGCAGAFAQHPSRYTASDG
jgi:hypothetical protein